MGISMKSTSGKILASVALVGTAAAVAGMGTYGAFTSTTSASETVATGSVVIALGSNAATNTLNVPITGMLPGDKVEKLVTLSNTGSSDLNNITLSTTAPAPVSPLASDTTDGLQLTIENCSTAWTGTAAPYTCAGTRTTVVASSPILAGNRALANLTSLTAAKTDNLKVTTSLPTTTPNSFQGATTSVTFAFTGTQRTETVK